MMKFFRKHTKHLLAFFMALLLVVWLAGDALTSVMKSGTDFDPGKEVRGQAFGKDVRLQDMRPAFAEAKILDELFGVQWRYPWASILSGMVQNPQMLQFLVPQIRSQPLSEEEWYLLDVAVRHAGMYVPPARVKEYVNAIQPERLNYVRTTHRISNEQIDMAIHSMLRVQQAIGLAIDMVKISEADIQETLRQIGEKAKIVAVTVEAKPFIDPNYQPTPEELKTQFDKYKDTASRPGDTSSGYQVPDAVQIEYVAVDPEALAKRQSVTEDEIYQYWTGHKQEFTRPTTQPATTQPTTAPASRPVAQPYDTFSEARPFVAERLQKERGRQEALGVARDIIAQLQAPWATATTTQPENVKQAPESQTAPDVYPKLVDRLQAKYPGALKYGRTQLLDASELQKLPDLGSATAMASAQQRLSLPEAAALVPGLEGRRSSQNERFFRGLYETAAEPFVAQNGTAYVIRTIAAKPRHAPDSLEAVKPRLIEDIRKMKAYEEAERQARKLATAAETRGLETAFKEDAALKQKLGDVALKTPPPFARMQLGSFGVPTLYPDDIPGLGYNPELTKAVFASAAAPGTRPAATATQPAATQPIRVGVQPENEQQRWVVYQVLEVLPVTTDDYTKQRDEIIHALRFKRHIEVLRSWFSPSQIRARAGWKDAPGMTPAKPEAEDSAG